jgi:hypothetical protein
MMLGNRHTQNVRMNIRRSILKTATSSVCYALAVTIVISSSSMAEKSNDLPYPIVDTGQTKCYGTGNGGASWSCPKLGEKLYGQDANYPLNRPKYRDNGNGTVTDLVSGLMWEKGFKANQIWRNAPTEARRASTGGHTDWRVPSIKELYSLMNFDGATGSMRSMTKTPSDAKPYMDTKVFDFEYPTDHGAKAQNANRFIDAQYITSTAYAGTTMGGNATFFGVNFADGRIKGYPQTPMRRGGGYYLRLVRGNPAYGKNELIDVGNGVVRDQATGLEWTLYDSGHSTFRNAVRRSKKKNGELDWAESMAFCEGLNYAGLTDWRLPNAKTLQGILDYNRSPQRTSSAAINPIFHTTQITDERGQPNFPGYWTSTTHLDGRYPGTDAIVVYFGEALGAFKIGSKGGQMGRMPPGMGRPPMGGQIGQIPPGMGRPPIGGPMGRMPPGMGRPPMGGEMDQMRQGGQGPIRNDSASKDDIIDVHGAGAQRSDPKVGSVNKYPIWGHGPQGDVRRVFNHVRCVRTAD